MVTASDAIDALTAAAASSSSSEGGGGEHERELLYERDRLEAVKQAATALMTGDDDEMTHDSDVSDDDEMTHDSNDSNVSENHTPSSYLPMQHRIYQHTSIHPLTTPSPMHSQPSLSLLL